MDDNKVSKKLLIERSNEGRRTGRSMMRRGDSVEDDLIKLRIRRWKTLACKTDSFGGKYCVRLKSSMGCSVMQKKNNHVYCIKLHRTIFVHKGIPIHYTYYRNINDFLLV